MPKYRVTSDTSTRASPDPSSPDYEKWLYWQAGETTTSWPDHAPVDEWVTTGHWEALPESAPEPEPAADQPDEEAT